MVGSVLIVGGGFGGVACGHVLDHHDVDAVVVPHAYAIDWDDD